MKIGYVGLGVMGGALAKRLQLMHELNVFDLSESAVQQLIELGATASPSLAALGERCDAVFLCLPTSAHVRTAIFGENGLASTLRPGSIIVDQTSGEPSATRAMAAELESRGIKLIDAPVSGGPKGADAGTIAIMVGATEEQFERIQPILAAISPNVFFAGGVGSGHVIKCVNNMISCAQRVLTYEGMALAVKNGVDRHTAINILLAGGARNSFMEKVLGPNVVNGKLAVGFTLGLAHKDLCIASQLGTESGVPLLFGDLAKNFYQQCMNEMGHNAEVETAGLVMDRITGSQVIPPDYTL